VSVSRYRDLGLFLALAAVWGAAFMAIKAGLGTPSDPGGFFETPVLFAAVRYDIAGLLMLGYAVYAVDDWLPRGRGQWATVAVGSLFIIAAYHALLFIGETDPAVTSAAAAVIVSLNPILTTGFSRVLLPESRLTLLGVVGLLLGVVGAVVLANPDPSNLLAGGVVAKAMILAAVAAFALGSVLTERFDAGLPIEAMEAWSMLGGALVMHAVAYGLGERTAAVRWTFDALWSLAFLAVLASAVGFLIYFDLLERLGSVEINLVSYVVPPFAALSGWLVLGETPTVETWLGFLFIVVGFVLLKRTAIREEVVRFRDGRAQPSD
jgi:drug/metabolite transporter (DMT)-like permease